MQNSSHRTMLQLGTIVAFAAILLAQPVMVGAKAMINCSEGVDPELPISCGMQTSGQGSGGGVAVFLFPDLDVSGHTPPTLTVTQIEDLGDSFLYRIVLNVYNNGATAFNFTDRICYSNSSTCDDFAYGQLPQFGWATHTIQHTFAKGVQFESVDGFADVFDSVRESNENNNQVSVVFQPSIP